jgi:uncharacterized protein YjiS (DUF1127 family)
MGMNESMEKPDRSRPGTEPLRGCLAALRQGLAGGARRLWNAYWYDRAWRATVLLLDALDDRILEDIGLSRQPAVPTLDGETVDGTETFVADTNVVASGSYQPRRRLAA